ncbi:MAG TPA: enoyl-CoA hydratase/isomerase family protein [Magnetospirillaceae bacterium]|jgi:methylglutaconyl-CoA hydratase
MIDEAPAHRLEIDPRGVARVTLARAEKHNAFDAATITGLTDAFSALAASPTVRVIILQADGPSFSAGADLDWMREQAEYDASRNLGDARKLAKLMRVLNTLPKPTIARVQGPAYGGGVGLVACCDIAIATNHAVFSLTEVKLGLIPSVISPYVIAAIGPRAARRLFLTAERIDAAEAHRLGLVHEVVPTIEIDSRIEELLNFLLSNGPEAMAAAKDLVFTVTDRPVDDALVEETARRIAYRRASAEGKEGVDAFLAKRKPSWRGQS